MQLKYLFYFLSFFLLLSCSVFPRYTGFEDQGSSSMDDISGAESPIIEPVNDPNLLFWSKLDSKNDLLYPTVGPGGIDSKSSFTAGKYGNAYLFNDQSDPPAEFRQISLSEGKGCIEFWAQVPGLTADTIVSPVFNLLFISVEFYDTPVSTTIISKYSIAISDNDGWGAAGICGWAGSGNAGMYSYIETKTYGDILSTPAAWHHYALSWDISGVKDSPYNMQLFLDGVKTGTCEMVPGENHNPLALKVTSNGIMKLSHSNGPFSKTILLDNLKVWNYAKTDFSDRFKE